MNKKSIIAIVVILCVVIIGAIGFTVVKDIMIKGNPVNYLLYSATQSKHEAYEAKLKASFDVDKETLAGSLSYFSADPDAMANFITSIVDQLSINGDIIVKASMEQKNLYVSEALSIDYKDKPLVDFGIGLTQEQLSLESKTFYDKSFTLSKEELFQQIKDESGVDLSELDFNKYIDLLNMEKDPLYKTLVKNYKGYETILRDTLVNLKKGDKVSVELSNGKEIKCDELQVSLTMDEMLKAYIGLINEAKTDEHLKALAKSKLIEILSLVISSEDYKILQIEKTDLESAIKEIDTNFESEWNKAMDQMITTYQEMQSQFGQAGVDIATYNIAIAIDNKYNIRRISYNMNMMGFVMKQEMVYSAYDKDVETPALSMPEKSVSLVDLMKDETMASDVGYNMLDQGLTNIIKGEALNQLMSDLKTNSEILPANEKEGILSLAEYFFENKEMLKEMILSNFGL